MGLDLGINDNVAEIRINYPESRVINQGNGSLGDPTVTFIEEKGFSGTFDIARIYALMTPACFLQADLYRDKKHQYSLMTDSGWWNERLSQLTSALEAVATDGLKALESHEVVNHVNVPPREKI